MYHLEQEAIYILWKAASFKRPYLLFSGGKDSIVMVHLAKKAFFPEPMPFKLLHIDTGPNFQEALIFRDKMANDFKLQLEVRYVEDTIQRQKLEIPMGKFPSRNILQTYTLKEAIEGLQIDCCIGGGRRDEEKSRAKERIFSIRTKEGGWNPYTQQPEPWDDYNTLLLPNHQMRVFPLSNFTEIDIWRYIQREKIELPSIYFAHERSVISYQNKWVALSPYITLEDNDIVEQRRVRYRTVGDMTCTAAILSDATSVEDIIKEIKATNISERGATRMDDQISDTAMEDRKKTGYF